MRRPAGLWRQYEGKALAELARGSGVWPPQPHACQLVPPWEPYERRALTAWDCIYNDWDAPWQEPGFFGIDLGGTPIISPDEPLVLPAVQEHESEAWPHCYRPIRVEQFVADESTFAKAEQFLLSLSAVKHPVAFELIGHGASALAEINGGDEEDRPRAQAANPRLWLQFVAHRDDVSHVCAQLRSAFPNSAIVVDENGLDRNSDWLSPHALLEGHGRAATLHLSHGYAWPLKSHFRFEPDPLGVAIAALDELGSRDWGMLQVVFYPTHEPWALTLREALSDPYNPGKLLTPDISERMLNEKFSSPLFAASVRLAAKRKTHLRHLLGWAEQFAAPPQHWEHYEEDDKGSLAWALMSHSTYRPGVLLNARELAALVHLPGPGVASENLRRSLTRTRRAQVGPAETGQIVLGENTHRGMKRLASIAPDLRVEHCYLIGATGTGKSTLMCNMICQDIAGKHGGVAVIDPHGDLVKDVLARIPPHRQNDVIYFNAPDRQHPIGFNILQPHSREERETIVEEILAAFRQHFSDAWGPRLQHILWHALATTVRIPGGTLVELRRLLTEKDFRNLVVSKLNHGHLRSFWQKEFPELPKGSVDPILNKLSPFLMNTTVRNIICQRRNKLDFDSILADRKILLVNLAAGKITHGVAGVIGMMLFMKIAGAVFRRGELPKQARVPFFTYIDEFQNFMEMSARVDLLLTQARKFGLALTMAHQHISQLAADVRASIFGNVATRIAFRLGIDDAKTVAKELQPFQAQEIINLGLGQALARLETSQNVFNVSTFPEPPAIFPDPSPAIIARSREQYGFHFTSNGKASPSQASGESAAEIPRKPDQARAAKKKRSTPKPRKQPPPDDPYHDFNT